MLSKLFTVSRYRVQLIRHASILGINEDLNDPATFN
jgi:hypothetical protein